MDFFLQKVRNMKQLCIAIGEKYLVIQTVFIRQWYGEQWALWIYDNGEKLWVVHLLYVAWKKADHGWAKGGAAGAGSLKPSIQARNLRWFETLVSLVEWCWKVLGWAGRSEYYISPLFVDGLTSQMYITNSVMLLSGNVDPGLLMCWNNWTRQSWCSWCLGPVGVVWKLSQLSNFHAYDPRLIDSPCIEIRILAQVVDRKG